MRHCCAGTRPERLPSSQKVPETETKSCAATVPLISRRTRTAQQHPGEAVGEAPLRNPGTATQVTSGPLVPWKRVGRHPGRCWKRIQRCRSHDWLRQLLRMWDCPRRKGPLAITREANHGMPNMPFQQSVIRLHVSTGSHQNRDKREPGDNETSLRRQRQGSPAPKLPLQSTRPLSCCKLPPTWGLCFPPFDSASVLCQGREIHPKNRPAESPRLKDHHPQRSSGNTYQVRSSMCLLSGPRGPGCGFGPLGGGGQHGRWRWHRARPADSGKRTPLPLAEGGVQCMAAQCPN